MNPDNWIPRSSHLIKLTDKHPFKAEQEHFPPYDAGLVTQNKFHNVIDHGSYIIVFMMMDLLISKTIRPCLIYYRSFTSFMWKLTDLKLSTDQLIDELEPARLQLALPCNGNRREESQHDSGFQRSQFQVSVVVTPSL